MKRVQGIVILLFVLITKAYPGWVLTVEHYDTDNQEVRSNVIYFQDNRIKIVDPDLTTVFDLNQNMITFLKPQIHMFWKGTLEHYRKEVRETLESMIDLEVMKLPEEKQDEARRTFETMMRIMEHPDTASVLDIFIRETGERETILGYQTAKFQVFLNGVIMEDLWIPDNLDVSDDLDQGKYLLLLSQLSTGFENELVYQISPKYTRLIQDTYILRTKDYKIGYQTVNEVVDIRKESLDESVFLPPGEYKPVTLTELGIITMDDQE
jgi:hypothetical protein